MGDEATADAAGQADIGTPDDTPPIQDFIVLRELAEVYLLLDNVSAVKSKVLPDTPPDSKLFDVDRSWIEQICEIAWPPDGKTRRNEALMAAQLIRAKDMLNAAAAPATGASIAFTTLMTGDASDNQGPPKWQSLLSHGARGGTESKAESADTWPPTRGSLAAMAYPSLASSAALFKIGRQVLIYFLVVWLVLTCIFSWDVATGSALLNRVNDIKAHAAGDQGGKKGGTPTTATSAPTTIPSSGSSPLPTASTTPASSPTPAPSPARVTSADVAPALPAHNSVANAADAAICALDNAELQMRCTAARANLQNWLDANTWPRSWFRGFIGGDTNEHREAGTGKHDDLEWGAVFIAILTGTILPISYGVLGAAAAVVRGVSMKLRDYTLMPRDLILAGIQLALGAVIGACIGLFVSSDAGATGQGGLVGSVHLTQSALCFVAGFGVEGVFQALEELVRRVFNLDDDRKPAPAK